MILVYTKTRFSWLNINFPQNGKMIVVHAVSQDKCILPLFRQFRNQSYSSLGGGGWREGGVGFRRFYGITWFSEGNRARNQSSLTEAKEGIMANWLPMRGVGWGVVVRILQSLMAGKEGGGRKSGKFHCDTTNILRPPTDQKQLL